MKASNRILVVLAFASRLALMGGPVFHNNYF